jgi:hypothetical protein
MARSPVDQSLELGIAAEIAQSSSPNCFDSGYRHEGT